MDVALLNDPDAMSAEAREAAAQRGLELVVGAEEFEKAGIPTVSAVLASEADPARHDCETLCSALAEAVRAGQERRG